MKILITNNSLATRAGTELVVWELAKALRARGHEVAAYSSQLGEVAGLIRDSRVPVIQDPADCPFRPDIIHGQHHLDTMTALLSLPDTPAIYHAHGGVSWLESAPKHPRILHYVAMCSVLAERIGIEQGIPAPRLHTVSNWVDMGRFKTVRMPAEKPRRALIYTRMLGDGFFYRQIQSAFERQGISLERPPTVEKGEVRQTESLLPDYDIVLAAGRSALEAIACGCATMIVNYQSGLGFVTPENLEDFQEHNMAPFRNSPQLTTAVIERQLGQYDAASVASTTEKLRRIAGLDRSVDQLLGIYQQTIDEWKHCRKPLPADEIASAALYLRKLLPALKTLGQQERKIDVQRDRKIEKLTSKIHDLKLANAELKDAGKNASRNTMLMQALRRSVFGRFALHFAKNKLKNGN